MQMLRMMESVVLHGSGKKAYIPGIRIGGKTGTTEKLVNGRYDGKKAYSSFIGVAPIDDPQITVMVVVDEPENSIFGSVVAAPIAHEILTETLRYIGVEPDNSVDAKIVVVPDLIGKTYEQAEAILKAADLEFSTIPITADDKSMYVTNQFPLKGTKVNTKSTVVLYFE
jgi:stage V sporulation protein D (sporulation-specific penicillin-binding protein)